MRFLSATLLVLLIVYSNCMAQNKYITTTKIAL